MGKTKLTLSCTNCNYIAAKWMGKCPECGEWNSFEEVQNSHLTNKTGTCELVKSENHPKKLNEIQDKESDRYVLDLKEFNRVLGGGLTKDSLTLIGGEPGIGKSTLLLEVCKSVSISYPEHKILYVSGEESGSQVAKRCQRLGFNSEDFLLLNETNWQLVVDQIKKLKPKLLILDSIQTMASQDITSPAGSINQVKEIIYELMNYAKSIGVTCLVVGHVTKDGNLAGPKLLEHMVDTVLSFEGERSESHRVLRTSKNRFGGTNEIGFFELKGEGLFSVENPGKYLIESQNQNEFGRTISCILEGTRPLAIEIQSLVVDNKFGSGKRITHGLDQNRLAMLVAILDKYFEIPLSYNDIYLNIVGGLKLSCRDSDLALVAALFSSYREVAIPCDTVFLGEVGLCGEVRPVKDLELRAKELKQIRCKKVITNLKNKSVVENSELDFIDIKKVSELLEFNLIE